MSLAALRPNSTAAHKLAYTAAWIVVGLIVAGTVTLGALRASGFRLYSVASNSMSPILNTGDMVIVATHHPMLRPGQVVSFHSPADSQVIITHRLIGVDNRRGLVVTKGDNAAAPDAAVPESAVVGSLSGHVPLLGYILDGLRHPVGLALAVYLPSLSIFIAESRRLARYYTAYAPRRYVLYR